MSDASLLPLLKRGVRFSSGPDDILDFLGESCRNNDEGCTKETLRYQKKYQTGRAAQTYDTRYLKRKNRTTRGESRILRDLLSRYTGTQTLLDLPCGGGRLSPVIAEFTGSLLEMDLSSAQLLHGQQSCKTATPTVWLRASALHIPLEDNSVDGAVCIRLSHHLYSSVEREKLIAELLRVVRRFAVFYFVDGTSPRYLLRRWRDRLTGASRKINWMSPREVQDVAARHGGRVAACPALAPFLPHRYALIEKQRPDAQ